MPKLNEFLFGSKGKNKKLDTKTKEQQDLLKLISDGLSGGDNALSDLFGQFDQEGFNEGVSKPALKQFQDQILPMINEKYIANNQALSGARQKAQVQGATDLQSKLAELMYGAQNQQKQNRLQGLNTALGTNTFENVYKPGTEGAVQGFVKGVGNGLGNAAGTAIAG